MGIFREHCKSTASIHPLPKTSLLPLPGSFAAGRLTHTAEAVIYIGTNLFLSPSPTQGLDSVPSSRNNDTPHLLVLIWSSWGSLRTFMHRAR